MHKVGIASIVIDALQFVPVAVLAISVALAILFRKLLVELHALRRNVGIHHVVLTAVGTMHGLVRVLEEGLESGGLPEHTRKTIYRAHAEQVRFVYDRIGAVSGQSHLFADGESVSSDRDDRPIGRDALKSSPSPLGRQTP